MGNKKEVSKYYLNTVYKLERKVPEISNTVSLASHGEECPKKAAANMEKKKYMKKGSMLFN